MNTAKNRREFLLGAAASLPATSILFQGVSQAANRKMKMDLHTGNIGVKANLRQQIDYTVQYGFEAFDPNINELVALSDADMQKVLDEMASKNITFGFLAQSVPIPQPDEKFAEWTRTTLSGWAKAMQRAKMTRFCTWLSSGDDRLTYIQNFKLHARRISDVATVLGDHGISFGLEYAGPKTSWAARRYPFVHTIETIKELIAETGKSNVGFLLDSYHWHSARETTADILALKSKDVIGAHLNDAPKDVPLDQLRDGQREIPMLTGVIDTASFVNALNQIGYDGPIAAEPLGSSVRTLPPEEALAKVADGMKRALALIQ